MNASGTMDGVEDGDGESVHSALRTFELNRLSVCRWNDLSGVPNGG